MRSLTRTRQIVSLERSHESPRYSILSRAILNRASWRKQTNILTASGTGGSNLLPRILSADVAVSMIALGVSRVIIIGSARNTHIVAPFKDLKGVSRAKSYMQIAHAEMVRPKVLVTRADVPEAGLKLLRAECTVDVWEQEVPIPRSELIARIKDVDALFCLLTDKVDNEVLEAAGKKLRVIATMSVGVDHLDLKALKARSIAVGYTPGVLTDATAELTMALLLATSRRLIEANRAIYKGEWKAWSPTFMTGPKLSGSNIGIVGLGRIGFRVAEYLKAFGVANIFYTSRSEKPDATKIGLKKVELDNLLKDSDFVIVTTALTPETREMFKTETFEKMKRSSIFINISRGEVVHQPSLVTALKNGTIRAAGLDVMTPEPIPLDSELLKLDNCVIIPHLGSAATETREEMAVMTAKNILAVIHNKPEEMPNPLKF